MFDSSRINGDLLPPKVEDSLLHTVCPGDRPPNRRHDDISRSRAPDENKDSKQQGPQQTSQNVTRTSDGVPDKNASEEPQNNRE